MGGEADPYTVLGVGRDAGEDEIHRAYRAAVRRSHPDAGGSAAAFEAVQKAYETLRDPRRRSGWEAAHAHAAAPPPPPRRPAPPRDDLAGRSIEELLAESHRLEDEARRLAGLRPRYAPDGSPLEDATQDSLAAVARDAGAQLRDTAEKGVRELRRIARRWL